MANPPVLKQINQRKKKKKNYFKKALTMEIELTQNNTKKEPYKTFTFGKHITLLR